MERTCEYREGLYVGYRYYDAAGVPVRYPFGHGLSYTSFAYSDLKADADRVTFCLTNTGDRDGAEIAQVYIRCKNSRIYRTGKELKGFAKVFLKAGESKEVTIALDDKAFRYFDIHTGNFEVEAGEYEISVAASSGDVKLSAAVEVAGTAQPREQAPACYRDASVTNVSDEDFAALLGHPIPDSHWTGELDINDPLSRLGEAKGALARQLFKILNRRMEKNPSDGDMLYIFHLPLRATAKATGGMITENMVKDFLRMANGHGFKEVLRLIGHSFSDKKKIKAYRKKLEQ